MTELTAIRWDIVLIGAAVIMAALNIVKDVLPGRSLFNHILVYSWLRRATIPSVKKAAGDLVDLAAGGRDSSLYRLPINQLAAQINAAAEAVLDFPAKYENLFVALCGNSDRDVTHFLTLKDGFRAAYMALKTETGEPIMHDPPQTRQELMDMRTRLTQRIQRRIDDLQIHGRATWRLMLQMAALMCGALFVPFLYEQNVRGYVGSVLAAGLLAPVVHDLLSAVTSRRGAV